MDVEKFYAVLFKLISEQEQVKFDYVIKKIPSDKKVSHG